MRTEEMLAIFHKDGQPAGVKPRSAVHRDGDWHMLAFLWVARRMPTGRNAFLLQLRGRSDDRFYGHVDAPAGGHVAYDESPLESVIRECREEMGVSLGQEELIYLGRRQVESAPMDCQRTFQHHYLCRRPLSLSDLRLTEEVTGFLEFDLEDFARLVTGELGSFSARRLAAGHSGIEDTTVTSAVLALYSKDVKETFRLALKATLSCLETGSPDRSIFG